MIWTDVLGIREIGINDDFLELGGQSLLAIQLLSRVHRDFYIELPLDFVFSGTFTIAEIAKAIDEYEIGQASDEELSAIEAKLLRDSRGDH
jgi:acyl carrier protein